MNRLIQNLLLLVLPVTVFSQEDNRVSRAITKEINRTNNESFMEQTLNYSKLSFASPPYMDVGSPKKAYILSADIIPQFVIGGKWSPIPIHLTPGYKVRIFRNNDAFGDSSLPVRTPSFMPGASVYFRLKSFKKGLDKIQYGSISYFHHSNGQDGPEIDRSTGKYNTYNGNFSTNFFEAAYHFRNRLANTSSNDFFQCQSNTLSYRDVYGRIGFEQHFAVADTLRDLYGLQRVNATIGMVWVRQYRDVIDGIPMSECYLREHQRLVADFTFIGGRRHPSYGSLKNRINVALNYHWRVPSSPNTALFVGAGYYGSDTYNVYFEQSYFYARIGVSLGFFVAPGSFGHR